MHAITAGKVTCSELGCFQPATVTVNRHGVTELPVRAKGDNGPLINEHEYEVEYCARCAERWELHAVAGQQPVWTGGGAHPDTTRDQRREATQ